MRGVYGSARGKMVGEMAVAHRVIFGATTAIGRATFRRIAGSLAGHTLRIKSGQKKGVWGAETMSERR